MKQKYLFLFGILLLFSIQFVSAVCTLTADKTFPDPYNPSSTITITASCGEVTEKNTAYIRNADNKRIGKNLNKINWFSKQFKIKSKVAITPTTEVMGLLAPNIS